MDDFLTGVADEPFAHLREASMQTVAIASQKGGSGKTTLARNISVAVVEDHRRTLCIDLDPQGSLRGCLPESPNSQYCWTGFPNRLRLCPR